MLKSQFFRKLNLFNSFKFEVKTFNLSKKASAVWVSWVFLIAFVVMISAFVSNFMTDYTTDVNDRLKQVVDGEVCNNVGLIMEDTCQTKEIIEGYISNKQPYTISRVIFQIYDIYSGVETIEKDFRILKNTDNNFFRILKQGVTKTYDVVPVVKVDGTEYICQEKKLRVDYIPFCQ